MQVLPKLEQQSFMVKLLDGEKHIHTGNNAVPIDGVLNACTQGAFDDCNDFYKVVRRYLNNDNPESYTSSAPFFRQMVAIEVVRCTSRKYGVAEWQHRRLGFTKGCWTYQVVMS